MMYSQQNDTQYGYIQSGGGLCLKYSAMVHQIFLLIVGSIVLGFGIWLAMWTTSLNDVGTIFGNSLYMAGYALLIVIGLVMLIISILGCCGSQQENSCLLLSFLIVIILIFVGLVAATTLGFIFNNQMRDYAQSRFTTVIEKFYGVSLTIEENQRLTKAMDAVQKTYECCGAHGNANNSKAWYIYRSASPWYVITKNSDGYPMVPESCCVLKTDKTIKDKKKCQGFDVNTVAGRLTAPRQIPPLRYSNINLHETGCYNRLLELASKHAITVGGVGIAFAIYMFIGIILVFCLLYSLEHAKYEYHHQQNEQNALPRKNKDLQARGRPTGYRA